MRKQRMDPDVFISVLKDLDDHVAGKQTPVIDLAKSQGADPFKILVGTVMSARTSDATTKDALQRLFSRIKDPKGLAALPEKKIADLIFPVGFYRTKAKHLKSLAHTIAGRGEIPSTRDGLMALPGVGRKTANLVLAVAFAKPAICVDTHVHRISNRLGLISTKTPLETEECLMKLVSEHWWNTINRVFVAHGQTICRPVIPHCSSCPVNDRCERHGVEKAH